MEGEIKNGKLNGKVKISDNNIEFNGEYLDNIEWKGILKENEPNYKVEGKYKNYKFSGKVKEKNRNGEFSENIYLNGKFWTGMKLENYDYYCSPKSDDGLFIGEYLNGRKWKGKGKELYPDRKIFFEGEYDKGKKLKGKEYYLRRTIKIWRGIS